MLCWYSQLRTESSCCCQWTHCLDPAARSWSSWSPHWLADSGDWCCWDQWCSEWLCSIFLLHLLQPHLRWLWDVSLLCSVEKIGIDAFSGYPAIKYNLFWHRFVGLSHVCSYLSQEAGCTQQQDCGTSLTWKLTLFNLLQSEFWFFNLWGSPDIHQESLLLHHPSTVLFVWSHHWQPDWEILSLHWSHSGQQQVVNKLWWYNGSK